MTEIYNNTQYQIMSAFYVLNNTEFDAATAAEVDNVTIQTKDDPDGVYGSDDVFMLKGDNNKVSAGSGDNQVFLVGDNNLAATADGDDQIYLLGDNNTGVSTLGDDILYIDGNSNTVVDASGDNRIILLGDSNKAVAGAGNNKVAVMGDGASVNLGDGNQYVAYWGDNNTIIAGNGNSTFATMDNALKQNQFSEFEDKWLGKLDVTHSSSQNILTTTVEDDVFGELSDRDKVSIAKVDLKAMTKTGLPKYVVALDASGKPRLYIYKSAKYDDYIYKPVNNYSKDKNEVAINSTAIFDYYKTGTITGTQSNTDVTQVSGVSGTTIIAGNGNNTVLQTVADGSNSVTLGNGDKRIEQELAYTFNTTTTNPFERTYSTYQYSAYIAQDE